MELAECSQSFHGRQEKRLKKKKIFPNKFFADFYRDKTGILATNLIFPKKEIPITSLILKNFKQERNGGGKKLVNFSFYICYGWIFFFFKHRYNNYLEGRKSAIQISQELPNLTTLTADFISGRWANPAEEKRTGRLGNLKRFFESWNWQLRKKDLTGTTNLENLLLLPPESRAFCLRIV